MDKKNFTRNQPFFYGGCMCIQKAANQKKHSTTHKLQDIFKEKNLVLVVQIKKKINISPRQNGVSSRAYVRTRYLCSNNFEFQAILFERGSNFFELFILLYMQCSMFYSWNFLGAHMLLNQKYSFTIKCLVLYDDRKSQIWLQIIFPSIT